MVKLKIPASEQAYRAQVAALPYRGAAGEVLLVSSRESRRWIVPKGWPIKGLKDHQAAEREAYEEAGVIGRIEKHPFGGYTYQKRLNHHLQPCRVMVYLLAVEREYEAWPEKHQRERRWMPTAEAASRVSEPGLASMILRLGRGARVDGG
jgi:8-oxo-dGTP pyrophosphatase MutT (NUDIX family)